MQATQMVVMHIQVRAKPVGSDLGTREGWFVSTHRRFPPSDNRTTVSSPQLTARIFSELFTRSVKQTDSSVLFLLSDEANLSVSHSPHRGTENSLCFTAPVLPASLSSPRIMNASPSPLTKARAPRLAASSRTEYPGWKKTGTPSAAVSSLTRKPRRLSCPHDNISTVWLHPSGSWLIWADSQNRNWGHVLTRKQNLRRKRTKRNKGRNSWGKRNETESEHAPSPFVSATCVVVVPTSGLEIRKSDETHSVFLFFLINLTSHRIASQMSRAQVQIHKL